MAETRTIEIDFDVHKLIELERTSFGESDNSVLRRLLNLKPKSQSIEATDLTVGGRAWSGKGVSLPHGTELRMEYNGRVHIGYILEGRWVVEGKSFNSPSAAAGGVALTKNGQRTSLDGWIYWHVKRPGDKNWVPLSSLRH